MNQKKPTSILRKFLLFNLLVFSILGLFTFIYLKAIQPNLVNIKSKNHLIVIKNTTDHLQRLKIDFNEKDLNSFLLSTRFLFQSLDRVQFFNLNGNLVGDTDMLDIDQNVFSKSEAIIEQEINNSSIVSNNNRSNNKINDSLNYYKEVKDIILNKLTKNHLVIKDKIKNDFFVRTLSSVLIDSVYLTKKLIGFKIYLFKKTEKIKITRATARTVLVIKFFLSLTATIISLACSLTIIYPTNFPSIETLLSVRTKKSFFILFFITRGSFFNLFKIISLTSL